MFLKRKSRKLLGWAAIGAKPCPGVKVRFDLCATVCVPAGRQTPIDNRAESQRRSRVELVIAAGYPETTMVFGGKAVCILVRWGPIFSAHWCRVLGLPATNQWPFVHHLRLLKTNVYRRLRNAGAMS
jgi:hypothetical protein